MDICGIRWADAAHPCDLGDTSDHVCYNPRECTGQHECACGAVPPVTERVHDCAEHDTWPCSAVNAHRPYRAQAERIAMEYFPYDGSDADTVAECRRRTTAAILQALTKHRGALSHQGGIMSTSPTIHPLILATREILIDTAAWLHAGDREALENREYLRGQVDLIVNAAGYAGDEGAHDAVRQEILRRIRERELS